MAQVIPEEFYKADLERLLRRGNHSFHISIHGCGATSGPSSSTGVSTPKVGKLNESHKKQKGKTPATSGKFSEPRDLRYKIQKKDSSNTNTSGSVADSLAVNPTLTRHRHPSVILINLGITTRGGCT